MLSPGMRSALVSLVVLCNALTNRPSGLPGDKFELDATYLSAAALEIAKSGVFGKVFDSSKKFLADLATRNCDLSAAALKPAHFVATDPYAGPFWLVLPGDLG